MIEYFRCSSHVSLETTETGIQIVKCDDKPVTLSPIRTRIVDILLRMPDASLDEILTGIAAMTQKAVSPASIASDLEELGRQQIVEMIRSEPRINMPYPIDHRCEMCGCSCLAQLVGPLNDAELNNIMDAHRDLNDVPKDVNPIMKGLKPDGTCLHFVNFPGKRCFFLDDNNLCRIHGKFGAMKKPAACRRFPLIAIQTESEIRIGIKPYCYANMRVCNLEPCSGDELTRYRADSEMKAVLDDLIESASFRPVVRVPDPEEILQGRIQESQILRLLQTPISYPSLVTSIARGARIEMASLPKPFIQDVQKALKNLAPHLRGEAEKLGTTSHANHVRALCDVLEKPLKDFSQLEPDKPFGKYVRYALYEAVFLRETSRFPAVSLGTFALCLGGLAAAQDIENASDHLTAWMRIFAQTQAFSMLFPSHQAMAALMRHL
ncbi:MAG: hypothetical protein IJU23_07140 [Proteobacteria bacterium]|nr:hypothetical protein [Pseudomonadota bacterium]